MYKLLEQQNKLTADLLIFNRVTSLVNKFGRFIAHLIFKPRSPHVL